MLSIRNFLIILLLGGSCVPALAQEEDCSCPDVFSWVQEKLERNYAGYRDKVTDENREAFAEHTAAFATTVDEVPADTSCHRLIREWSGWFRDGHVQLNYQQSEEEPEVIRERYADWERLDMSAEQLKDYLDSRSEQHPLEGIWQSSIGSYQVGIIRDEEGGRDFMAFILQADSVWWMPGQIKFELFEEGAGGYRVNYYMRNHSLQQQTAGLNGLYLEVSELGSWYQLYPEEATPPVAEPQQIYSLETVDSQTLLLRLPTMNENFRKQLSELLDEQKELLESTPNWIIDCRGNGGGSDITYYPLRPYIATGDIRYDHTQTWATEDNAEKYTNLRHNKNFPWLQRIGFGMYARKMRRRAGEFIGKKCSSTEKTRRVRPLPERVVILVDGDCASSCEQFLLYSRQSEKVTLMGSSSAGILDYGNLHWMDSPCGSFTLYYPTSRSCRVEDGRGIDNVGIPPDVELGEEEDWVERARQHLQELDR